ncbi:cardiolipin synthase [Aminobacter sp. HY435]|uniref:cardiolipin synthase n=1 Tax=Aminobacter sp. HY435 TaxID=2970917 RepID=UPI0022B990DA|nr:cardiolipin synthase [Aminobacter sp. HY435]
MNASAYFGWALVVVPIALQVIYSVRALLRPHREPASRLAWVVVIVVAPVVGVVAYILFGDTNVGRRRIARLRDALKRLPSLAEINAVDLDGRGQPQVPERYAPLFRVGESISNYPPVGANRAQLMHDSDSTIDAIVADIDAATDHVHLLFYIWLPDGNGVKMVEAVKRAAMRGVICRVMVDDIGSRRLIRSPHWRDMASAKVRLARALPVGIALLRPLKGRVDMRNHRKIVVIDNSVTYCGSQNCADPAFAIKAKYAPWVDVMMRFEGPIVLQNQHLFASDWMAQIKEDLSELMRQPLRQEKAGFTAQVIGTGATVRYSAMPEMFISLMNAARHELVISTPYYVPDEPLQAALCACAHRGIATSIIFPQRNDSWIVAAASRSYYRELLDAGVRIYEYAGGLLHAKTLTVDGEVMLIGSANLDRRSFELNFENNILLHDRGMTARLRARQQTYIDAAVPIDDRTVARWSKPHQLWNNAIAMLGPVL